MLDPQVIVPLGQFACSNTFGLKVFPIIPNACHERKTNIKRGNHKIQIPAFPLPHPSWGMKNPESYEGMWYKLDMWLIQQGIEERI